MEVEKRLSVEDLMKPRYKVIAAYPNYTFDIGGILIVADDGELYSENEGYCSLAGRVFKEDADKYPHLFKKLEWWEDLKPKQLPKYVKWNQGGIFEVVNWRSNPNTAQLDGVYVSDLPLRSAGFLFIKDLLPATESEYLTLNK